MASHEDIWEDCARQREQQVPERGISLAWPRSSKVNRAEQERMR